MKTKLTLLLCWLIVILNHSLARAQGNLIINGGFENGFTGWSQPNNPFFLVGTNGYNGLPVGPAGGNSFAFYQDSTINAYGYGLLVTDVSTVPGVYYTLKFSSIAFDGTNTANVYISGNQVASINFATTVPIAEGSSDPSKYNLIWQNFSYTFQAVLSDTQFLFQYGSQFFVDRSGGTPTTYFGAGGFDNISLVQIVPEPSTLALLGAGLAGGLAARWRTRRQVL